MPGLLLALNFKGVFDETTFLDLDFLNALCAFKLCWNPGKADGRRGTAQPINQYQ